MAQVIVPGAASVSEWASRVNGVIAGCGQAGILVMSHLLKGTPLSTQQLTALITQGVNAGQTVTPGGVTTLPQLQWLASQQGITTQQINWRDALRQYAGRLPIEIGVNNATVFGGANASVHGHYIDILGVDTTTGNYLVADPNTPQAQSGGLVQYSASQIAAADPFGAIIPTGVGGGPVSTAGSVPVISGVGDFFSNVTDIPGAISMATQATLSAAGATLKRGALVILGLIVLALAVFVLLREPITNAAKTGAGVAAKVAVA